MWYLVDSEGKLLYLRADKATLFGRKTGNFIFPDDQSLSRTHASFSISVNSATDVDQTISKCKIMDLGSKYGTYIIQGEKVIEILKEGYYLKVGDKVRLGLQNTIFRVGYKSMITVTSTLNSRELKTELQNLMMFIDGAIFNKCTKSCTHLTVAHALSLTEKVTYAMAATIPIVTMDYWRQVKIAMKNGEKLPNTKNFTPLLNETVINISDVSILPNERRRTVFQNLKFVFFDMKQYNIYQKIVVAAGGKSVLYSRESLTTQQLCDSNVIVLQYSNNDMTQSTIHVPEYDSVCEALGAINRRMIPESEIPLAILYCSIDKYCNPTFKFATLLRKREPKPDTSKILVVDTQDVTPDVVQLPEVISNISVKLRLHRNNFVIPETCDDSINQSGKKLNSSESRSAKEAKTTVGKNTVSISKTNVSVSEKRLESDKLQNTKKTGDVSNKNEIYIPETDDSSPEKFESQNKLKSVSKNKAVYIPESNDLVPENLESQNRMESISKNKAVYIPETNDSSFMGSIQSNELLKLKENAISVSQSSNLNFEKRAEFNESQNAKEMKDTRKENALHICPRKNLNFESRSEDNMSQNIRKIRDCKENSDNILETNDSSFRGGLKSNASQKTNDSCKENAIYIPETNKSFSDVSSENEQPLMRNVENLKSQQNINKHSTEFLEEKVVDIIDLTEDRNYQPRKKAQNIKHETSNEYFKQKELDGCFGANNKSGKALEAQTAKSSVRYKTKVPIVKDVQVVIDVEVLKSRQGEQNFRTLEQVKQNKRPYNRADSPEHSAKRTNFENVNASSLSSQADDYIICVEKQKDSNTLPSCSPSSFLRLDPGRKSFKKIYNMIPERRVQYLQVRIKQDVQLNL